MVIEQLTEKMRADGHLLTKALEDAHLRLSSALWFYFEDANQWRYVFVSPLVHTDGPKFVYKAVQKVLRSLDGEITTIELSNIVAVPTNLSLAPFLRKDFDLFPKSLDAQMSKRSVDGQFINDSYVYRIVNGNHPRRLE